jgi:preprotein translocase subunit Sec61beta
LTIYIKNGQNSKVIIPLTLRAAVQQRRDKQKAASGGVFEGIGSSAGLQIEPHYAIVVSLLYVGIVIILHMIGKYRKDASVVA